MFLCRVFATDGVHSGFYDEVYSPHRQYGQYRQTDRLTDRYKYNKTDIMKTNLKEKIKTRII